MAHLKIGDVKFVKTESGYDMLIKRIGYYDNKSRLIKDLRINQDLKNLLKRSKIIINPNDIENLSKKREIEDDVYLDISSLKTSNNR